MSDKLPTTVVVRRTLPVPPGVVYDEWLDPAAPAAFITPAPARSGRVRVDPRVGGSFLIEMVDPEQVVRITGEYLELDRPRRLRFTWRSSLGGGFDSTVTVSLEADGEMRTLMTIEHALLPADQRADHEQGWEHIAAQLASTMASRTDR